MNTKSIALASLVTLAAACTQSRDVKTVTEPRPAEDGATAAVPPTDTSSGPAPTGYADAGSGKLHLGANGRIQGVMEVPYAATGTIYLTNLGPGKAVSVIRVDGGPTLKEGPLTSTFAQIQRGSKKTVIVVLESQEATDVEWRVEQTEYAHATDRIPPVRWTTTR